MRPVSDALLSTVRGSHGMAARARVVASYQEGVDPDGVEIPIVAGDVQLDASADVRSTVALTTTPEQWGGLLPYGDELFVERGVRLGGGVVEWVSLGYFRIDSVDQESAPYGEVLVAGKDRMAGIKDDRLTAPRQYPATRTYGSVVSELVLDIYPAATIEWDDATETQTINRAVLAEEDRYAFINDLITSAGKIWYFDYRGVLVIATPPNPTEPVFEVNAGADGVLIQLSQSLSREGVYNGVVAFGEAADTAPPVRALAVDTNPNSPTVWGGRFGKVPRFYSSPLLTTVMQCQSAAASLLRQTIGLPYSVDFTLVSNPALEPLDPVLVVSPKIPPRVHVLDKLTVPLVPDAAMTAATREQTLVIVGTA